MAETVLSRTTIGSPRSVDELKARVDALVSEGNLRGAAQEAYRHLRAVPDQRESYLIFCDVLVAARSANRLRRTSQRALVLDPSDGDGRASGSYFRAAWMLGDLAVSLRAVVRWSIVSGDADASLQHAHVVIRQNSRRGTIDALIAAVREAPDSLLASPMYYTLERGFAGLLGSGMPVALAGARMLLSLPEVRLTLRSVLDARPGLGQMFYELGETQSDTTVRDAFQMLAAGEPAGVYEALQTVLHAPSSLPESLSRIVEGGPDAGHPYWHVVNPFFVLWRHAREPRFGTVQNRWVDVEKSAGGPNAETLEQYERWQAPPAAASAFLQFLDIVADDDPTILDIGCGRGFWLRFAAERGGVPIDRLKGIDIHLSRVNSARALLVDAVERGAHCSGDLAATTKRNIFVHSALDLNDVDAIRRVGKVDIVTMFVATGCFDDSQLKRLLNGVSNLAPKYIFTTTVSRRWSMWHGRDNEVELFAHFGYHQIHHTWVPDHLALTARHLLVAPRKYWTNLAVRIYRRAT
jgi:SAM-dependent methyltransferase